MRPCLPALDRHGQAGEGAPGEGALAARRGAGAATPRRTGARSSTPRVRAFAPGRSPSGSAAATCRSPRSRCPASTRREGAAAVYFPSCTNRIMGASKKARPGPSLADATVAVSERAGMPVWIPPDVGGSCCGVPWSSKGHREGHAWMARQTFEKLWRWSDEGEPPGRERRLVVHARPDDRDARRASRGRPGAPRESSRSSTRSSGSSGCCRTSASSESSAASRSTRPARPATSGLAARLSAVAAEMADEVAVPAAARCCGFAGDRGMLHPELTASATAAQAAELARARSVRRLPLDQPHLRDRHGARDRRALRLDRAGAGRADALARGHLGRARRPEAVEDHRQETLPRGGAHERAA